MNRREAAAARRRANYELWVAKADDERKLRHALVYWWLAEVKKQPPERLAVEVARLFAAIDAMNRGVVTECACNSAMPVGDATVSAAGGRSCLLNTGARDQHTTAPTYVTQRDRAPADTASGSGGL